MSKNRIQELQAEFASRRARSFEVAGIKERVVTHCACALRDKPFTVTYERASPDALFVIASIDKIVDGAKGSAAAAARLPKVLNSELFDQSNWACPWCGNARGLVNCSGCGTIVCHGRTDERERFVCRASCGRTGRLVPAGTMKASDAPRPSHKQLSGPGRLALPSARKLLK